MFFSKDEKNPIKRALQGELLQDEPFIQLCTKIENYLMDTEAVKRSNKAVKNTNTGNTNRGWL
ncbi:Uncharacterised protein [Legionella pneumophila]|nr:Uncharacterised protein [Legionella pneumophila]